MKRAFTLVELLVTIAIVVVIAALLVPVSRYAIARARSTACIGNLRSIGVAIESYLQDNGNVMPDLQAARRTKDEDIPVLETVLDEYVPNPDVFDCPADKTEFERSGCSYVWNNTQSGRHKLKLEFFGVDADPRWIPLVLDKEAWHPGEDGLNVLYADYRLSNRVEFRTSAGDPDLPEPE